MDKESWSISNGILFSKKKKREREKEKKLWKNVMVWTLLQKGPTTDLISYFIRFSKQSQMRIVQLSEKHCQKNFSIGALAQ